MSTIGSRIGAVRRRSKLTQEQFASRLGFSRRALVSWEKDQVDPPTKVLTELRTQFDVDPEWILLGDDDVPRRFFSQVDWAEYDVAQAEIRALANEVRLELTDDQLTGIARTVFADGRMLEGEERARLKKWMRAMVLER